MNWAGVLFGACAAIALLGGAMAAFARSPRAALLALAPTMLGIAGMTLSLGYDFLGIVVAAVLAAGVPAASLLALAAAPQPEAERVTRRDSLIAGAVGTGTALAVLYLLLRTEWLLPGGQRHNEAVWLGWSLLSTDLAAFVMLACLLAACGIGAVVVLRGRRSRRQER
ncbi:MAG TPA: NADH-quinone oxidoreductase subunit J [Gemmatimonadales bacterium]|nr:NADH-quinone oxidoreductase subunit J [Gemmatimonadales bacterium]